MTPEALDEILAEEVVFHSPIVHSPQKGRALTKLYLMAAYSVLPGDATNESGVEGETEEKAGSFRYVREVFGAQDAVLEFVTEIDGIVVNGVDMIRWNDAGRIVDFKVMVRPLKAIQKVHAQMAAMLERLKKGA
ncbi:MAG: nuclear transport factor 2 family protein [Deltaproteobacteria bacterium]|jgi:hypothetical protein|nr:nuclear transport factor 2 family protein [Deltaproteobacteria bacterium]MBW2500139.1 nuclear transport factor 2 family protein [Deltaproteobacteria bacterium]